MSEEIWLPVKGYEVYYEVSSFGRVRSLERVLKSRHGQRLKKASIMKQSPNGTGYLSVCLSNQCQKKNFYVHRLVADAFLGVGDNVVDHLDSDRSNNVVWNLDVVTQRENIRRGVRKRKTGLPIGVTLRPDGKFLAFIRDDNGKQFYLGFFETPEDAESAYWFADEHGVETARAKYMKRVKKCS